MEVRKKCLRVIIGVVTGSLGMQEATPPQKTGSRRSPVSNGQKTHEKMLTISSNKGNAN
jgi:hypothetical protein